MENVIFLKKKCLLEKFKEIDDYVIKIESFENYSFHKLYNSIHINKNQLFSKEIPSIEFVKKILFILLNKELDNSIYFEFTIHILINKNVKEKIQEFIPELKKYYLKCKHKIYLDNLNEKKIITIFRQILKPYNYYIRAIEKYENGEKYLLYILEKKKDINLIKKKNIIINFD